MLLNSCLDTEMYIEQPKMFQNKNYNQILCFCQNLYKLKQSTCFWSDFFVKKILIPKFNQIQYDSLLFFNKKKICIVINVDNLQIIELDFTDIENLKTCLSQQFKMIDFGFISYYFSMKVNISTSKSRSI